MSEQPHCATCGVSVVEPQAPVPIRSRYDTPRYCRACHRLFPALEACHDRV